MLNGADNTPMTAQEAIDRFGTAVTQAYRALEAIAVEFVEAIGTFADVPRAKPRPETWRRVRGGKQQKYF